MAELSQRERSLGELFGQLTEDMTLLVRQEVQLARTEIGEKVSRASKDLISVTTGAIVAYIGGLALVAALILFLWQVVGITPWLSALIVGVVLAVGGYVMLRGALRDLKRVDPKPERTIRTIKGDIEWAKEQRP
ncbi:MAG TPA: phage holin family protein [Gemmatimonadales bacterium]|jgi:UDP-N-acetylmuramyl pentapeptide phosphotransferase/UDP-N-acetylglucosamine-1-phosphate transferase|nr:phage holin family protein [Gemmatimonadales bacterium]